ncbi:hypothetical protein [Halobacillus sp. BBL2006]|uniref:hypothetical protein n=1 Tax=Halobacillus sp. BBL2006 TaxID=1543706 RepID=UPI000542CF2F|nr:hypothetical protein [Halobacillus sp. BBL2006]KHE71668.1 hypothetical protein LD39_08590 [Halobacillus sp. BBL2006]
MDNTMLAIGEHFIEVTGEYSPICLASYDSFITSVNRKADLTLRLQEGYGRPFLDYEVEITSTPEWITFQRADYLVEVDANYEHATLFFHNDLGLKHALMNLYSAYIVHQNWGLLIHSSCAIDKEQAHIFSGHSGVGKSTVAKMSQPRALLSDEATILKVTDEGIKVYPSPFWSELRSSNIDGSLHLSSIQLLHQAEMNDKRSLKKSIGLMQLIDKVFYWSYSPEQMSMVMNLLKRTVDQVPIHELHFKKDPSFWELIS